MVLGMPLIANKTKICDSCLARNQTRKLYPDRISYRATRPLELLPGDLCGLISPCTPAGSRYMFLLVDDMSRYTWCYILKSKDQVFYTFKKFKALVEKQIGFSIGTFGTNRGGEFTSKEFNDWCDSNAI